MSFVDKSQLEPGCAVLLHNKSLSVVGTLADDVDPMVSVMKVDKAPLESYADVGGLEDQIQEIKEAVELPLTHPELYEDIGIKPPKGVILYGEPGTGKTLLAKAVANSTSASFLRVVGSELIQKYLGDGPKLVRELFRVAEDMSPSIVFIDEIDAIGTKRYDSNSGGEKEIQRTMIELLTQMDGFEARGEDRDAGPGVASTRTHRPKDRVPAAGYQDEAAHLRHSHRKDEPRGGRQARGVCDGEGRALGRGYQSVVHRGGVARAERAADAGDALGLQQGEGEGAVQEEGGRPGGDVHVTDAARRGRREGRAPSFVDETRPSGSVNFFLLVEYC
eukprot:31447-Pelagococcus_subviridis.AAC.12